jgi:hypothetical protein
VISTTAPAQDNAASIDVAGTAEAGSTVALFNNGSQVGTATADAQGHWAVNGVTLIDGADYSFTAKATDAAGNTGASSNTLAFHADQSAPNAAVISTTAPAQDNAGSINVAGSAEAGSTVALFNNGSQVGAATADAQGHWAVNGVSLTDGTDYSFTAKATDAAGNTGVSSNALTFHSDQSAPNAPVISTTAPTQDNAASINVAGSAEAGSTVALYNNGSQVGTATADAQGHWTVNGVTLADGADYNFTAKATDAAGNTGASSNTLSFHSDQSAPNAPSIASFGPDTGVVGDGVTNVNTLTLTGTAEANSSVNVYDGATLLGSAMADGAGPGPVS